MTFNQKEYDRNQWQPIATAPKDGTQIIGCSRSQDPVVVAWNQYSNEWVPMCDGWVVDDYRRSIGFITKWHPMPVKYQFDQDEIDL